MPLVWASDEQLNHAKDQTVQHESFHQWSIEDALRYFMYFIPNGIVVRSIDVDSALEDLNVGWNKRTIATTLYGMSADGTLVREYTRQSNGVLSFLYAMHRQKRIEFRDVKRAHGQLLEGTPDAEPELTATSKSLGVLIQRITDGNERAFAEEAEKCLQVGALRAAVVMSWNLAYAHFRSWVFEKQLTLFNALLTTKWRHKHNEVDPKNWTAQ